MKRHTLLLLLPLFLFVWTGNLLAQERSMQELKETARAHFRNLNPGKTASSLLLSQENDPVLIGSSSSILEGVEKESFYIFGEGEKKFVILSADQKMPVMLGYSGESTLQPGNIPDGLKSLLASYQVLAEKLSGEQVAPVEERIVPGTAIPEEKKPLLNGISWAQDYPYSNDCPETNGTQTLVGCVATAMSSIMAYYKYPAQGKGNVSYNWNGQTLKGNFSSHSYDWDKIRDTYPYIHYANSVEDLFTSEESQEVAKLCYDVALSIQTSFGTQASNSYNTVQQGINSFVNHFSYDPNVQVLYRNYFSRGEWLTILRKEIAEERPVLYRGGETALSGHVFIADGYDKDGYIHFDFGWGGVANGYYHIAAVSPDNVGAGASGGSGFNIDQFIFVGLQPPAENSYYQSHIVLNKELSPSKTSLGRTEIFSLSAPLVNKGTAFNGTYCAMLFNKDGNSYELNAPASMTLYMDVSRTFSLTGCQVPENLPPGLYELRIMVKDSKEKEWNSVRALSTVAEYCIVQVRNEGIELINAPVSNTLLDGKVTAGHTLYKGHSGTFTLTLSNGENEFLGTLGIGALQGDSYTVLTSCTGSVQSGETISYSLSEIINLNAGEYTLIPIYKENGQWKVLTLDGETVTVKTTPSGSENLICTGSEFLNNENQVARSGMLECTLSLTNDGGAPYSKGLIFAFFHNVEGSSYSVSTHFVPLFLDSDDTAAQTLRFPHNLPEGDYQALLYKFNANGATVRLTPKESTSFAFTVVNDSVLSGILSASADNGKFILEYGEGEIIIRSPQPFTQIKVLNSNGICISTENITGSVEKWSIPTRSLGNGLYLIRARQTNGSWQSGKFMVR